MTKGIYPPIAPRTKEDALHILSAFRDWLAKEYEAQDKEIQEWVDYANAISTAHGMHYGSTGPEDPGPDPCAFDVWAVQELRRQRDFAQSVLRECAARWDKYDEEDAPELGRRIRSAAAGMTPDEFEVIP